MGTVRKIDYDELKRFLPEFRDSECARIFKTVSRERVRQLRKKWKIPKPKGRHVCLLRTPEAIATERFKLLNKGLSIRVMAKKLNMKEYALRGFFINNGVDKELLRVPKNEQKKDWLRNPEALEKAKPLYKEGKNRYQIAKAVGVTHRTVTLWIEKGRLK